VVRTRDSASTSTPVFEQLSSLRPQSPILAHNRTRGPAEPLTLISNDEPATQVPTQHWGKSGDLVYSIEILAGSSRLYCPSLSSAERLDP
jgi:hypothetical protein